MEGCGYDVLQRLFIVPDFVINARSKDQQCQTIAVIAFQAELIFLALCEIAWVAELELPTEEVDHVDEIVDIAKASGTAFG